MQNKNAKKISKEEKKLQTRIKKLQEQLEKVQAEKNDIKKASKKQKTEKKRMLPLKNKDYSNISVKMNIDGKKKTLNFMKFNSDGSVFTNYEAEGKNGNKTIKYKRVEIEEWKKLADSMHLIRLDNEDTGIKGKFYKEASALGGYNQRYRLGKSKKFALRHQAD